MVRSAAVFLLLLLHCVCALCTDACTTALVHGSVTADGRPLLWKNRDTSTRDNRVANVAATSDRHAYTALFNTVDSLLEQAWIGVNDVGFAIMNSQAYNLPDYSTEVVDREGFVMTRALESCASVADFAALLDSLPRPMGVQANFGVIDANGDGGYFETTDSTYTFYPLDAEHPALVRANYAMSGTEGVGKGYTRYCNAEHLLQPFVSSGSVTPATFTDVLTRSRYSARTGGEVPEGCSVPDGYLIRRNSTTAAVVVQGVANENDLPRMWTILYPSALTPTADAVEAMMVTTP